MTSLKLGAGSLIEVTTNAFNSTPKGSVGIVYFVIPKTGLYSIIFPGGRAANLTTKQFKVVSAATDPKTWGVTEEGKAQFLLGRLEGYDDVIRHLTAVWTDLPGSPEILKRVNELKTRYV